MAHRTAVVVLILIRTLTAAMPAPARHEAVLPRLTPRPPGSAEAAFRKGGAATDERQPATAPKGEEGSARDDRKARAATTFPAKPFTRDQVERMVRDSLADFAGAKAIEQRGINFALTENFLEGLQAAGASRAFLAALRAAKRPEPASAAKAVGQTQVFALLGAQVPGPRVAMLVWERGVDFDPTPEYQLEILLAGGGEELRSALKGAAITASTAVDPSSQVRQRQASVHAAQGTKLAREGRNAEAEQEFRVALLLDAQDSDLYLSLAYVQGAQQKWNAAEGASRQALSRNANNSMAHAHLGAALANQGNLNGAIAEEREALRLDPNNAFAHNELGIALEKNGDLQGASKEYRAALTLDPQNPTYRRKYDQILQKTR